MAAEVFLKKGGGRLLKSGGAWIFDNEIERTEGVCENGDIVSVFDFDGYPLGTGFINRCSKIRVRMLSRRQESIDEAFIRKSVRRAWEYRKSVMCAGGFDENGLPLDISSCRLIFGEADFLPGLVVDKFGDVLVAESLALGIDRLKPLILKELIETLEEDGIRIRGVYERSEAPVRAKEGMEPFSGPLVIETEHFRTEADFQTDLMITENGLRYLIDIRDGQKTGFFLDQKYNRLAVRRLCRDKKVLDCFTHLGTFALNAAAGGAAHVTAADISASAIAGARKNAELNGYADRMDFLEADVLDLLPALKEKGEQYDLIVLDPPAFTKSREAVRGAVKGYREINRRAMQLIRDGGYLASCSCSHFMEPALLEKTIREAAAAAHKRLRLVEYRQQAPDHPVLLGADESLYLKFFIFQVVDDERGKAGSAGSPDAAQ